MTLGLIIPSGFFAEFRLRVMVHYFVATEPLLSRHLPMCDEEYDCASFTSDREIDIEYVISILPPGSIFFFLE